MRSAAVIFYFLASDWGSPEVLSVGLVDHFPLPPHLIITERKKV